MASISVRWTGSGPSTRILKQIRLFVTKATYADRHGGPASTCYGKDEVPA